MKKAIEAKVKETQKQVDEARSKDKANSEKEEEDASKRAMVTFDKHTVITEDVRKEIEAEKAKEKEARKGCEDLKLKKWVNKKKCFDLAKKK